MGPGDPAGSPWAGALEACIHLPAGQAVYLSGPQFPCL